MANGKIGLKKWLLITTLFVVQLFDLTVGQFNNEQYTIIRNRYSFIADRGLVSQFAHTCNDNKFKRVITESTSIETLIDLVQRLEDVVANTSEYSQFNSPDGIARIILQRFHMDSVNFVSMDQDKHVEQSAQIDTKIIAVPTGYTEYRFPDYVFTIEERCSMLFMFSHYFANSTYDSSVNRRVRRATYQFSRNTQSANTNPAINSPFADQNSNNQNLRPNVNVVHEKGVVSFREDKLEAIAPARVFMGIIAGLSANPMLSGKTIAAGFGAQMKDDIALKDPVLAVTFGNLMGTAMFFETNTGGTNFDQNLIYGAKGTWVNDTCCTYYAMESGVNSMMLHRSNRGSLAQIRGSLDGYIIGKNLKNVDGKNLKLSSILKSYYSAPHSTVSANKLGVSYCDRNTQSNRPQTTELNEIGNNYNQIYKLIYSQDTFHYRGDQLISILDRAASTQSEFCSKRPSGSLDRTAPCETHSDLIFIVDPKSEEMSKTAQFVSNIVSKINKIDRYAGSVSVFANSLSRLNTELPTGPGGWPLAALIFNATNPGSVVCRINPTVQMSTQTNLGKFLLNVNQTIFNYKWWTPRRHYAGVPSTNVIMLDYGSLVMPTTGADKDDYDNYKNQLKWRNRDVRFLISTPNPDFFKDFVREQSDIVGVGQQSATDFANKICENPATLICNDCYPKESKNQTYEGFITPGYKQNWAIYPEYFDSSSAVEFKVKALDGSIKYCWDRTFPPEKQENCKDLQESAEDNFKIWEPCSGETVHTCNPIYFTVWGKERTSTIPCKDVRCLSLDQVKFSIGNTGLLGSSAFSPRITWLLQAICIGVVLLHRYLQA